MAKLLLMLCLFMFGYCVSKKVHFNPCTGKKLEGEMTELEIIPCETEPCKLHRGTNVTMKVHFTSHEVATSLKGVVHAKVAGFQVPFPLPHPDGCHDCNITCPIKNGDSYVYETQLPIMKEYPRIDAPVTWELQDSKNGDLFCFVVDVKIA